VPGNRDIQGRANGASLEAPFAILHDSLATMRAPHQLSASPETGWPDTPPAAGRAWVPACRARTFIRSVTHFYDESRPGPSRMRDQFVILIGSPVHIPLVTGKVRPTPVKHPFSRSYAHARDVAEVHGARYGARGAQWVCGTRGAWTMRQGCAGAWSLVGVRGAGRGTRGGGRGVWRPQVSGVSRACREVRGDEAGACRRAAREVR
jgi:hypothetical protein